MATLRAVGSALLLGALVASASRAAGQECAATRLACEVDRAIDRGLDYLRMLEAGTGTFDGQRPTAHGFLGVLAFLERPTGVGWDGPVRGFEGLEPADRQLVLRAVRTLVDDDPALVAPDGLAFVYVTGGNLMALAAFLDSGGPDDVGARVGVREALRNGVAALRRQRGREPPGNDGGWNYDLPGPVGDLSVSSFAVAGLVAASRHVPGAAAAAGDFPRHMFAVHGTPDGGLAYLSPGFGPALATDTATGAWCLRLLGIPSADARVQGLLQWLHENWAYSDVGLRAAPMYTYYYLWAATRALRLSTDDEAPLSAQDFGALDPASLGYPEEPRSAYFDIAYTLLRWQDPRDGSWSKRFGIFGPPGQTPEASHVFALLTLSRSSGGACVDVEGDGRCGFDDNCPEIPNPDQRDEDADGLGDVCDNCPKVPNRDQGDLDGDGLGDACDRRLCVPDGLPEVCDGLDNDCDGLVDQRLDGAPVTEQAPCATGLPGVCSPGRFGCRAGRERCRPVVSPSAEVCNSLDDDCDGRIDEGAGSACGPCGSVGAERCDGPDGDAGLADAGVADAGPVDDVGSLPDATTADAGRPEEPARGRASGCDCRTFAAGDAAWTLAFVAFVVRRRIRLNRTRAS